MSKKLIFIGPPGAGKTTLRKIIFQGENSKKLLDYALEPTYGEESTIFRLSKLNEELGIHDLAGQENKRWFSEDKSIFQKADVILVVIDITDGKDKIIDFIKKIRLLVNEISLSPQIFVLIHKIDLVSDLRIQEIRNSLNNHFEWVSWINFFFTSIKREYFAETFSFFLDILKRCFKGDLFSKVTDSNTLHISLEILYLINKEIYVTLEELRLRFALTKDQLNYYINRLLDKNQIKYEIESGNKVLSLTSKAKENLKNLNESIDLRKILDFSKIKIADSKPLKSKTQQIIGFFMADQDGKTFLRVEIFDNALKNFMNKQNAMITPGNAHFDVELIPMFISALEKFSNELNIQNLSGFKLTGDNLKMKVFNFNNYSITFFANPYIRFKLIEDEIISFFSKFHEIFNEELEIFEKTGASNNQKIYRYAKDWLKELNHKYNELILNFDVINEKEIEKLYAEIDTIQETISLKTTITMKKLKKIKLNLLKAIMADDKGAMREIIAKINKIKLKYSLGH